jgi:signal peptide peptidase SppA
MIEGNALNALLHEFQSLPNKMAAFLSDPKAAEHPVYKRIREGLKPQMTVNASGVATLPIEGVLAQKPDVWEMLFSGVEDSNHVLEMVNEASNNPDVKAVVLAIDSPGGFMTGGPEIADAVAAMNKRKPVVAHTSGTMASLAYFIGSQAGTVVASRSAQVGSIGVYTTNVDYSRMLENAGVKVEVIKNKEADYKAAGVMGTPLTEAQRGYIQDRIQASFGEFKDAVKGARPQVTDDAMRGQVFYGKEAKSKGLIDAVGDLAYAQSIARSKIRGTS